LVLITLAHGWQHTLYCLSILLASLVVLAVACLLAALSFSKENRQDAWYWWCGLFEDDNLWYANASEVTHLVCDGTDKPRKVNELPRKHRTVKLRFSAFKSKVCRPFSS